MILCHGPSTRLRVHVRNSDYLRVLGPDHLHTLITRANLANMLGAAGPADQTISQVRDLLTDCLRVLGSDHPHTLATFDQLTFWQDQSDTGGRAGETTQGRAPAEQG